MLVILGHSFPDGDTGMKLFSALWIRSWLYSFHMGTFFILSGFVLSRRLYLGTFSLVNEIEKKAVRLLVPYFFYSFVTLGPKALLFQYVNNPFSVDDIWLLFLGQSPNGGMWFLWHLFIISITFLIVFKLLKSINPGNKTIVTIMVGGIGYILYEVKLNQYLNYTFLYSFFFAFGIIMNRYYGNCHRFIKKVPAFIAIILTVILACPSIEANVEYIFTGLLGFYGIFALALKVNTSSSFCSKVVDYLGTNSYGIYLISYFGQIPTRIILYSKLGVPYWFCVIAMFMGGLFVPIVAMRIIRKNKALKFIMLGEKI